MLWPRPPGSRLPGGGPLLIQTTPLLHSLHAPSESGQSIFLLASPLLPVTSFFTHCLRVWKMRWGFGSWLSRRAVGEAGWGVQGGIPGEDLKSWDSSLDGRTPLSSHLEEMRVLHGSSSSAASGGHLEQSQFHSLPCRFHNGSYCIPGPVTDT